MVQGYGEANSHSRHDERSRGLIKRYKCSDGYVRLYLPEHPSSGKNGLVMEHRYVAEVMIGRLSRSFEEVHHRNEVRHDNRPCNLRIVVKKNHIKYHNGLREGFENGS